MRKPFKLALGATVTFCAIAWFFVDVIPPRSQTVVRMVVIRREIEQFSILHNRLPSTLAELPLLPGYDAKTTDAWGRPIDYSFDASAVVTLRSLGADRQPGGEGTNRDIVGVFAVRDLRGHWANGWDPWIVQPDRQSEPSH